MRLALVVYLWITLGLSAAGASIFAWAALDQNRPALWAGFVGCLILGALISKIIDNVEA